MADCIDCGININDKPANTICPQCLEKRANELLPEKRIAMAKVGFDALIDEVTDYQQVRPKGDLKKRYEKYLEE